MTKRQKYMKKYSTMHKEEIAAQQKTYRATRKEEAAVYNAAYYVEHKEEINNKQVVYRAAHKEEMATYQSNYGPKYYTAHRKEILTKQAAYLRENPDKVREYNHKRRARKLNIGGTFTAQQFLYLCAFYNNTCLGCKRTEAELSPLGLMIVPDHVQPLSRGGSNRIENIQPLCHGKGGCNNKKFTKHIDYRGYFPTRRTK